MSDSTPYFEKLRDPRWQRRRLDIMERDGFKCRGCLDKTTTLNVHHLFYEWGRDPWDYDDSALLTLCEPCHLIESTERKKHEAALLFTLRRRAVLTPGVWAIGAAFDKTKRHPGAMAWALRFALQDTPVSEAMMKLSHSADPGMSHLWLNDIGIYDRTGAG